MSIQLRNTFWGIFLLILLFIQQNGFTQNTKVAAGNRNLFPPMSLNYSILPAYLQPNSPNVLNTAIIQLNRAQNPFADSKGSTAMAETVVPQKFYLKWKKSPNKKPNRKNYYLLIDLDSTKIAQFIEKQNRKPETNGHNSPQAQFRCHKFLEADSFLIPADVGGHFFWTVFERQTNGKLKCLLKKSHPVASYDIPGANLEIQTFSFEHSPWLTSDDYQGELNVEIKNVGNQPAEDAWLTLSDSVLAAIESDAPMYSKDLSPVKTFARKQIDVMKPGETLLIAFPWRTPISGKHQIQIQATDRSEQAEYSKRRQIFITIPKGIIAADENPIALKITQISLEIPIITEISFDPNSSIVRHEYLQNKIFEPSLVVLANRLKKLPDAHVILQGFSDANSDAWNPRLADNRSQAIRDTLINLGTNPNQIIIQRGHFLPKLDSYHPPEESQWIFEERRHVRITLQSPDHEKLLNPIQYTDTDAIPQPVRFESHIKTPIPLQKGGIRFSCGELEDEINFSDQIKSPKSTFWTPVKQLADSAWFNRDVAFSAIVTDSLGRIFKSPPQTVRLRKFILNKEHRMALPLKYAQSQLLVELYWARIFEQITNLFADPSQRLCFTGHACAIGSEQSNRLLSQKRAERFHAGLLEFIRKKHPEYYGLIKARMLPAQGFGESQPLTISRLNGESLVIGDNLQASGRRLNRRIEVIFSQDNKLSNF